MRRTYNRGMKEKRWHANTERWRWIPKIREKDHGKEKSLFRYWEKDGEQIQGWKKNIKWRKFQQRRGCHFCIIWHWMRKYHQSIHWIWQGWRLFVKEGLLSRGLKHLAVDIKWSQMISRQSGRGHTSLFWPTETNGIPFFPFLFFPSLFLSLSFFPSFFPLNLFSFFLFFSLFLPFLPSLPISLLLPSKSCLKTPSLLLIWIRGARNTILFY